MEMRYTEYKGGNCIYYERKNITQHENVIEHIILIKGVLCCLLKMNKYFLI